MMKSRTKYEALKVMKNLGEKSIIATSILKCNEKVKFEEIQDLLVGITFIGTRIGEVD